MLVRPWISYCSRPLPGAHLPEAEPVLDLGPRPDPDAGLLASNLGDPVVLVVGVEPKRSRLPWVVAVALLILAVAMLAGCGPARPPPPSVQGTLSKLETIEVRALRLEIEKCRRHAGGMCL